MSLKHSGTAALQTERLILRKFELIDIDDMMKNWICDHEVQSSYGESAYQTREEVEGLIRRWYNDKSFYRWAIVLKESNENIGQIAFCRTYWDTECVEVEYCIGKAYWRNGYATEALKEVIKYSFEQIGIDRVEAFHSIKNPSSGRVLQKAGMQKVANIKRYEESIDFYDDRVFYGITRKDYFV